LQSKSWLRAPIRSHQFLVGEQKIFFCDRNVICAVFVVERYVGMIDILLLTVEDRTEADRLLHPLAMPSRWLKHIAKSDAI
jgi:hypothetical protein